MDRDDPFGKLAVDLAAYMGDGAPDGHVIVSLGGDRNE